MDCKRQRRRLRTEAVIRAETGLGSPLIQRPAAIQTAVVDTAMLYAISARYDAAFQLSESTQSLLAPVLRQLDVDPVFEPVRRSAGFKQWLAELSPDQVSGGLELTKC
jgi:hypothetical protein